jgi:hypothetical protein
MRRRTSGRSTLLLVGTGAWLFAEFQVAKTRRELVERRLTTAAELLSGPATQALTAGADREPLLARLRDLGRITGLRLTLIGPDGTVLSDSEVQDPMPNLSDRPEVREAGLDGSASAFRRSAVTGKETLYVARRIERDGRALGVVRAATDASEIDATLAGVQTALAALCAACFGLGVAAGAAGVPRRRAAERRARDAARPGRAAA